MFWSLYFTSLLLDGSRQTEFTNRSPSPLGLWSVFGDHGENSNTSGTCSNTKQTTLRKSRKTINIQLINFGNIGGAANIMIGYLGSVFMTKNYNTDNRANSVFGKKPESRRFRKSLRRLWQKRIPYRKKLLCRSLQLWRHIGLRRVMVRCHASIFKNNNKYRYDRMVRRL